MGQVGLGGRTVPALSEDILAGWACFPQASLVGIFAGACFQQALIEDTLAD